MADIRTQLTRAREAANDIAGTASGKFRGTADRARESAGDLIQTGREKAGDAYADARDRSQRIAARANEIVQEHPIAAVAGAVAAGRSEEHTSELQSLMRISYAVFCLKKKYTFL